MIKTFLSTGDELKTIDNLAERGVWISLTSPSPAEIEMVCAKTGVSLDLVRAALDEEERPRIEVEEDQLLILINIPTSEGTNGRLYFDTIPLGIIVAENYVITVCLKDNPIMAEFEHGRPRSFYTFMRTRFVLQILFKTATYYLRYLKQIDKRTNEIENQLHRSMRNEELIKLLNLEKSLVYFTTSLKANGIVMEKLLRSHLAKTPDPDSQKASQILKMYADDEDLLEDVITENKQAIDMSETHSSILSGMMDAFASVISNNLNIVMKFLTSVTIVLSLPTMVASFYGMNVHLPFQHSPFAFSIIIGICFLFSLTGVILLRRKDMF
ncbi:MAG TPA: magnesium transporter CorA family protein [Firmicutes bacterium]|jgi:magnesium transporter|nr:magnesium transporter CorA family protein [Bacillota bacterium]HOQ24439.1 magnesium transporter CorA family protein [Bacillota bacterium]HPT68124.1 magnesium transporter CorA family protein [Bacillota bacterium]